MTLITRRSLFAAAPLGFLTPGMVGAASVDAEEAPQAILTCAPTLDNLFTQWKAKRLEWLACEEDSLEADRVWAEQIALEHAMIAIPAVTARDLAQKMWTYQSGGIGIPLIDAELKVLIDWNEGRIG